MGNSGELKIKANNQYMLGQKLSPVLEEIENTIWEHESAKQGPLELTDNGFRAALKIFMAALMDKAWVLQAGEKMDFKDRCAMIESAGIEFRLLVKKYTNIDTTKIYK